MPPRRGVPAALRISAPPPASHIALLVPDDEPTSPTTLDSAVSADSADYPPLPSARSTASRSSSMRNAKKLAINIPSAPSSAGSLASAGPHSAAPAQPQHQQQQQPQADGNHRPPAERLRRQSVVSLPGTTSLNSSLLHRKEEDGGAEDVPYSNGPVQIIPGIWIGSEENARDWKGLVERGIKAILNVAKEVYSPFDGVSKTLRNVSSTPNFRSTSTLSSSSEDTTLYPAHLPSGRPAMHYLKLQWSHGQQDLVNNGFQSAMSFVDAALSRNEGVLVHCQCGISRSATMVIALVMRAAQSKSPLVPPEVWDLKGMQGAYSFVKEKSPIVGPNMSLIYQLLDYEKTLRGDTGSDSEDSGKEDEEWIRKRRELDEASSSEDGDEEEDLQRSVIMQEARALDKAMEDRIIARKSSTSSINSTGSGIGMGTAWRSQYRARKRTGSIASSRTSNSVLSEDLLEEEEEEELLGIGGGFDSGRERHSSLESNGAEESSPDDEAEDSRFYAPLTAKATSHPVPEPLPSAPVWKTSFSIPPPPLTAMRSTFNIPPPPFKNKKKRPMSLSVLPTVPPSPIVVEQDEPAPAPAPAPIPAPLALPKPPTLAARRRTESGKPIPPPLALRNSVLRRASSVVDTSSALPTPSQTLFLFPPSPTMNTRTPSTMTLTTETAGPVPFPALSTPKVSTFRQKGGRTKSFIGLRSPPTPTVGFSKVDARGFFGMQ